MLVEVLEEVAQNSRRDSLFKIGGRQKKKKKTKKKTKGKKALSNFLIEFPDYRKLLNQY